MLARENPSERRGVWQRLTAHMNPVVFFGSATAVVAFVVFGAFFTPRASAFFLATQTGASRFFGWFYVLVATGMLVTILALLFTPARDVRIGGPDAVPEFSRPGWFAMLFAAGMGVGLVFFGVAEPVMHFGDPVRGIAGTEAALGDAMRITFFHWGLHAWAIYIVLALAIAHAHFNRGLPLAPRSAFEPLIGARIHGPFGDAIDILCTVGTLLGVATSLGLGAMQINASLNLFFDLPEGVGAQVVVIAAITLVATVSVVLGVARGVQRLSQLNIGLAGLLLVFVLVAGPTLFIVELLVSTLGRYLQNLPRMSLYLDPGADSAWQTTWTLFYWGWWISWSPFVAIFVARISRGRTVREFILGVLIVPALVTFLWLSAFGGTGLWIEQTADPGAISAAIDESTARSLQAMLAGLPFETITTVLATLVIALFFVTSSDSGSLVDDMVTSGGDPHPPKAQRVFWAVSEGAVAVTLLVLGGLDAIRNAAISLGLPMSLILVAAAVALCRALTAWDAADGPEARQTAAE